jgi:RNA polymerase sporulation-specific sigma factor
MFSFKNVILKFIAIILGIGDKDAFPPPLSQSEEAECFQKMKQGDRTARAILIEHNLRLVSHIIRKYYYAYTDQDELLSIGSLGLIKAVDTFNADRGIRFATYGAKCIQNEILMYFRSFKKTSLEVSINDTIDIDKDGNPLTYLDIIGGEESTAENIEMKIYIEKLLSKVDDILSARERKIIILRYGLCGYKPMTQKEIARHLKISRSYVSRIEKKALQTLRESFGGDVPSFD